LARRASKSPRASPHCWSQRARAAWRWPSNQHIAHAERACINTLEQALDVCDVLDAERSGALGVAVDAYHVWWDPKLRQQIERAGANRLLAFHVCDWLTPTAELLNDRGMMGDGVIDLRQMRGWLEAAGYAGYAEVEIFSSRNWWQREGGVVLDTCIERHQNFV
jgi:sugar phosphate isomerase/epimerase